MNYGYQKEINLEFGEAVVKVKEELSKQGFGVLTEINVKDTLKTKMNLDYEDYIILGACNPSFAHQALQMEKEIGLLLPCNVIVYSQEGKIIVSAINPIKAMSIIKNNALRELAKEVKRKLNKVIGNL